MKKYIIPVFAAFIAIFFIGCDVTGSVLDASYEPIGQSVPEVSETVSSDSGAYVYTDSVSRTVVYVNDSGVKTLIQSDEDSGTVICTDVIDFIQLETEAAPAASRSALHERVRAEALVLGKRSDGKPGLWGVYTDGKVKPVINSDDLDTTELLDMVEGRQPLSSYFNWSYEATAMVSNYDLSEIIIIGYAENSGIERHNYSIEEGTTVGVYWAVTLDEDGYYHISRARVVGFKDASARIKSFRHSRKSEGRNHHRWMWSLRLFFAGWYDSYLVMTDSVEPGFNDGEYLIYGEDQEGENSVAVVTVKKVLSLELDEGEDPGVDPGEDPGTGESSNILLFSSDRDGDYEIFALDLDTEIITQITNNTATDKQPAISADGSKVAFVSDRSGSLGIHTMDIDGSNVSDMLVAISGSFSGHPDWSPDGAKIAFDSGYELYTMNSDGTGQINITNTPFTNELEPDWSPDGTLIAYSSRADGDYDIFTMPSDGSGTAVKLTDNSAVDQSPSWSPDGTEITYSTNIASNYEIFTMNSDGSSPVNLTNSADSETAPSWSLNGIAFVKGGDIYTVVPGSADAAAAAVSDSATDQDPSW